MIEKKFVIATLIASAIVGCSAAEEQDSMQEFGEAESALVVADDVRAGELTVDAANRNDWHHYNLNALPQDPIFVVGAPSFNGGDPLTNRVKNGDRFGFDYKIAEWEYLDGSHKEETAGFYFQLPGIKYVSRVSGGSSKLLAGSVSGVTDQDQYVAFGTSFSSPPIVFATQVTHNGTDVTAVRASNITENGFNLRVQEQAGASHSYGDKVHYLAVLPNEELRLPDDDGDGQCLFMKTLRVMTDDQWLDTEMAPGNAGTLVSGLLTMNGSHSAATRYSVSCSSSLPHCTWTVWVKVDEEGSNNETTHTYEQMGVMTMDLKSCN